MELFTNLIASVKRQWILLKDAQSTIRVTKIVEDEASTSNALREIHDLLTAPVGFMSDYHDDDLLAELESAIMDEQVIEPNNVSANSSDSVNAASMSMHP